MKICCLLFLFITTEIFSQCKLDYSKFNLVFEDQFNYTTTDDMEEFWRFTYPWDCGRGLFGWIDYDGDGVYDTGEVSDNQYYTKSAISCSGGELILTAKRQASPIAYYCPSFTYQPNLNLDYKSGMIYFDKEMETECWPDANVKGWAYGLFEIRSKMPEGETGLHTAFWLYGGGTEIDLFEAGETLDYSGNIRSFGSTVINWNIAGGVEGHSCALGNMKETGNDLTEDFHIYSAVWTPDKVTFFFDGKETGTINNIETFNCPTSIIASLSMRPWATVDEAKFTIDFIKVYKEIFPGDEYKSEQHWAKHPMQESMYTYQKCSDINGSISYSNFLGTENVFYRSLDNKIFRYYKYGSIWIHSNPTFTYTSGTYVAGDVVSSNFDSQVFYRGADGRIQVFYKMGSSYLHGWVDDYWGTSSYKVSSSSGSMSVGKDNIIYYRGTDNKVHIFFWNGSDWEHLLPSFSYSSSTYISGYLIASSTSNQLYYRGGDGRIQTFYKDYDGIYKHGWIDDYWSTSAYKVSSAYGSMSVNSAGIFYRGTDNQLHLFYWDGSDWVHEEPYINPIYGSHTIGGKILASSVSDQIIFRGDENKLNTDFKVSGTWIHDWLSSWGYLTPETAVASNDILINSADAIFYRDEDQYIQLFYMGRL